MKIFVSGGCKNGKSFYSQRLARAQKVEDGKLYYVATMKPVDNEDKARIKRHLDERDGWGFETIEQPENISGILTKSEKDGSFLLDSTTALLMNEMFIYDKAKDELKIDYDVYRKISDELEILTDNLSDIVIVSDYIYSDAEFYDESTEKYRYSLAYLDKLLAEKCDVVLEVVYGNVIVHKGKEAFEKLSEIVL